MINSESVPICNRLLVSGKITTLKIGTNWPNYECIIRIIHSVKKTFAVYVVKEIKKFTCTFLNFWH